MLKIYVSAVMITLYFTSVGICDSQNIVTQNNYSVLIPDGWTIQKEENSSRLLMFGTQDEEIFISITVSPAQNPLPIDQAWERMKSGMTYNKEGIIKEDIINEGEEVINDTNWKKIEIKQVICDKIRRTIIYFTITNNTKWSIQCGFPESESNSVLEIFNKVKQSFVIKR